MDEDRRAARYAAADEAAQVFRRLLVRAANERRTNLFFAYAAGLARATNERAAVIEEALSTDVDTSALNLAA